MQGFEHKLTQIPSVLDYVFHVMGSIIKVIHEAFLMVWHQGWLVYSDFNTFLLIDKISSYVLLGTLQILPGPVHPSIFCLIPAPNAIMRSSRVCWQDVRETEPRKTLPSTGLHKAQEAETIQAHLQHERWRTIS